MASPNFLYPSNAMGMVNGKSHLNINFQIGFILYKEALK